MVVVPLAKKIRESVGIKALQENSALNISQFLSCEHWALRELGAEQINGVLKASLAVHAHTLTNGQIWELFAQITFDQNFLVTHLNDGRCLQLVRKEGQKMMQQLYETLWEQFLQLHHLPKGFGGHCGVSTWTVLDVNGNFFIRIVWQKPNFLLKWNFEHALKSSKPRALKGFLDWNWFKKATCLRLTSHRVPLRQIKLSAEIIKRVALLLAVEYKASRKRNVLSANVKK